MSAPQYTHETLEWAEQSFRWDASAIVEDLARIHFRRGELASAMTGLGFDVQQETVLSVLVSDVTKSSAIEGDFLNAAEVRSSIARRLGMDYAGLPIPDRHVEGVVEMMLDATQRFEAPLTEERIFSWHAALFPSGHSGLYRIRVGTWRDDADGPMQVVSGPMGKERVHFEAPPANRIPSEIGRFLRWFEEERSDPVVKAAIAHLWFVTIHPLDDGNGRIGRAIMDLALARADHNRQRFYSMSEQIHAAKSEYYEVLEKTQKSLSLDATQWVRWFLGRLEAALDSAEGILQTVRTKHAFWSKFADAEFNQRQTRVLNRLLEGSFVGHLQTAKYAKLAKCSSPTAFRDLSELVEKGALETEGIGKATRYRLIPI